MQECTNAKECNGGHHQGVHLCILAFVHFDQVPIYGTTRNAESIRLSPTASSMT